MVARRHVFYSPSASHIRPPMDTSRVRYWTNGSCRLTSCGRGRGPCLFECALNLSACLRQDLDKLHAVFCCLLAYDDEVEKLAVPSKRTPFVQLLWKIMTTKNARTRLGTRGPPFRGASGKSSLPSTLHCPLTSAVLHLSAHEG